MNNELKNLVESMHDEAEKIKFNCPVEIKQLFQYQIVPSDMGKRWDQAFSTMVFAEGDARQMNAYQLFMLCRVIDHDEFTLEIMKVLFLETVPLSAEFIWTCGLVAPWGYVQQMINILDAIETKTEMKQMLDAFNHYFTNYHNWIHFYFPWHVGEMFRLRKKEDVAEMARMLGVI